MTKSEFVDRVADQAGIGKQAPPPPPPPPKETTARVVDAMSAVLAEGLQRDSEVTIDGLGTFSLDESKEPKFRADPELKKAIGN